jgi:HK97 gp10 family phage protein
MSTTTVTLEGFEATIRALKRQPVLAKKLLGGVVSRSAFRVATAARGLVPVDTGDLLHAIDASATGLTGRVTIKGVSGSGGLSPSVYWYFVEMGTIHMTARPFLRPAAEQEEPKFIDGARQIGPALEQDFG